LVDENEAEEMSLGPEQVNEVSNGDVVRKLSSKKKEESKSGGEVEVKTEKDEEEKE